MRKGLQVTLVAVAAAWIATPASAQVKILPPTNADLAKKKETAVIDTAVETPVSGVFSESCTPEIRFWASAEYLHWWSSNANLPPMVTTSNNLNDAIPGALGQPNTAVVFGGSLNNGSMNGLRITLGGWIDESPFGWEGNAFTFANQTSNFTTSSDGAGNPPRYYPIYRPDVGREGVVRISQPINNLLGDAEIGTTSRLWGAEANALFRVVNTCPWSVALIGGFRYLDLQEGVTNTANLRDPLFDINRSIGESFYTRSQFYGGQFGAKVGRQWSMFSVEVTAKLALGATRQSLDIQGSDTVSGLGALPAGTFVEGVYTQTSNIGRYTATNFAVIPQGQLKIGCDLTRRLRATVGYDVLYWSQTLRAGEQIDRRVDVTQSATFGTGANANFPAAQLNRTGYWAHGISVGLEYRY